MDTAVATSVLDLVAMYSNNPSTERYVTLRIRSRYVRQALVHFIQLIKPRKWSGSRLCSGEAGKFLKPVWKRLLGEKSTCYRLADGGIKGMRAWSDFVRSELPCKFSPDLGYSIAVTHY